MSAQHTPGPVSVEVGGVHRATVGRATTENSAILRGMERRKAERAVMRAALSQADEFAALVEEFVNRQRLVCDLSDRARALRAAIAKATGGQQ